MAPQIGQRATLNGKPVIWAGSDFGYQSPNSFAQLQKRGELDRGAALIRRAQQALAPIANKVSAFQAAFRRETDKLGFDKVERAATKGLNADDRLPSSRVSQGAAIAAQQAAKTAGIDQRYVAPLLLLTGGVRIAQTGRGRILGQPGTTGTGRTPTGQPIKGIAPREPAAPTTPRGVSNPKVGDTVRFEHIERAAAPDGAPPRYQPANSSRTTPGRGSRPSSVSPTPGVTRVTPTTPTPPDVQRQLNEMAKRRQSSRNSWEIRQQAAHRASNPKPQRTTQVAPAVQPGSRSGAKPVGQVATDRSSAKSRRLRDWREQQRKGRAIVHGDNANGFGEPSTQTRNGIAGPSDLHGPYTRGYTTTVGNHLNNNQVAVFDNTRGPIGKGKGFATPPNKEVVRGSVQTPQQRIRNATPVVRPGRLTPAQEKAKLRLEQARASKAERGAKGIKIRASRGGDGKRIVYEGGPLNVQQENRYDPRGSRYRGRDTAEPRRTAAAMHEGEVVKNDGVKDLSRETGYNPGFSKTSKKKGVSGDAGSAANSAGGIRQQLIREFQATKAGGAVIGTSKDNRGQILRMGTKKPSEDWLVPRIQERLLEHRARIDAASGRRTPDSIQPGARRRGAAARLTEEQKRSGVANTTTYGGSVPQVPRPVTIRQQVPKLGNAKTARAVNETGNLRSRVKRARTARIEQIERSRRTRLSQQGQLGPTTDAKGKTVSDQVRDKLKETKDRAQRAKLRNQRDPQLTADTNARNANVRSTSQKTRGVTHSKPMSRDKAEATAAALEQRFGKPFGVSRLPSGRYVVNFTGRQLSGKHNTAIISGDKRLAPRPSRPVSVRPEAEPMDRSPSIRRSRSTGEIIKQDEATPIVGTSARRGQRVRFDSRTEQFIHSTNLAEVKVTPAKGVKPHRAGNKEYMRVETQRRILEARIRNTKNRTKKAELKAQLAQLKPPTKAATDKALAQVDLEQRTRTNPGDARGAGPFRAHNERVRAETKPRRSHIRGHRLPPEEVKNPSPPMPNIAEDGKVNPRGSFKTGGELKGVTERGRTNAKGRSSKSTKKAAALLQKIRDRRINEQKAPKVKPNSKRKKDKAMQAIRELRKRRAAGR